MTGTGRAVERVLSHCLAYVVIATTIMSIAQAY